MVGWLAVLRGQRRIRRMLMSRARDIDRILTVNRSPRTHNDLVMWLGDKLPTSTNPPAPATSVSLSLSLSLSTRPLCPTTLWCLDVLVPACGWVQSVVMSLSLCLSVRPLA